MKIEYKHGNMFNGSELFLAHGCNAQGVMNSGVAKEMRKRFPKTYENYMDAYKVNQKDFLGKVVVTQCNGHIIFNCITQKNYGYDKKCYVDYDAIKESMIFINDFFQSHSRPAPVAMPMIGAGLGGGNWNIIETIIEMYSQNFQPVVYKIEFKE